MMKVAPFWTPSEEEIRQASVTKLREFANARHGLQMRDYWDLHRWSTGSPEEMNDFWTALWDWSGIIGDKGTVPVSSLGNRPFYLPPLTTDTQYLCCPALRCDRSDHRDETVLGRCKDELGGEHASRTSLRQV